MGFQFWDPGLDSPRNVIMELELVPNPDDNNVFAFLMRIGPKSNPEQEWRQISVGSYEEMTGLLEKWTADRRSLNYLPFNESAKSIAKSIGWYDWEEELEKQLNQHS